MIEKYRGTKMGREKMPKARSLLIGTAILSLSFPVSGTAAAQEAQSDTSGGSDRAYSVLNEDIIVTAQRRDQNVQDVPISISAIGGNQLLAMNIQDAQRIVDLVPNFKASGLGGAG